MATVSAARNSSPLRNQLLAAMSATDFALLQPHLQPVALPLLHDIERPNRRIERVYFMEAGIASIVAVQSDARTTNALSCDFPATPPKGNDASWQSPTVPSDRQKLRR